MLSLGLGLGLTTQRGGGGSGAPANTTAPAITGTAIVGNQLSVSDGTWSGSPTSYAYQWARNGSAISGKTASTYTITASDVGQTITCEMTATNAKGSTAATSNSVTPDQTRFDLANTSASLTLAESGSRITSAASGDHGSRSTTSKATGKWYFEVEMVTLRGNAGVKNSAHGKDDWVGDSTSSALDTNSGSAFAGGNNLGSAGIGTIANSNVIGVAVDVGAAKIWYSKNGTFGSGQNPATATGGFGLFFTGAVFAGVSCGSNGSSFRLRTLASQFLTPPPSGFSAWDT